ncbi:MAG: flagellar biosynthesis protein FlhF [Oscillospiraceae bacterium]|nr:flagellar biosynthesis protein FlhF [Oscillospiraceae bacterium]MCL2278263.1 flagellar biosynthesis protein FlhF [Oscillospiraceae bacterium]
MQVKRYRANNMKQAMDAAIRELGSDAVMLGSTKVRRKGFKNLFTKPIIEVQFAYDPSKSPAVVKNNTLNTETPPAPQKEKWYERQSAPVAGTQQLEKRIDSFEKTLTDFMEKFTFIKRDVTYDYTDEVQQLLTKMLEEQVREELAHSLAKQTEQMLRTQQGTNAHEILEHLMHEQMGRSEPILHKKFSQKVILVLGPTGVGKTTSIVKLAADFSVKQRKKVGIINTDTYRIGAQEQLQTYADILGVPLGMVYYPDELEETLASMSDRDIIFVDTAGKRPGDEQHKDDILEFMRVLRPEDILLCLSATTGFASIKEITDTYGFVDDYRVMVTKMDETRHRGAVLNISWYTRKPLAYVTTGQNVPDDIEVVDVDSIVKKIVR